MKKTEEERWNELVKEYSRRQIVIDSEFGILDMSADAMNDIFHGEDLSYEDYLKALFNSRNSRRVCFEHCYYCGAVCYFKGKISRISDLNIFIGCL